MGRHRTPVAPPAEPPATAPPPPLPTDWGGYAEPGTDLEGWLAVLAPPDPPMMDM